MKKEVFLIVIVSLFLINFVSAFNLSGLIDSGLSNDVSKVEQVELDELENDPIFQIITEGMTNDEVRAFRGDVENILNDSDEIDEVDEEDLEMLEDYFIPRIAISGNDVEVRNVEDIDEEISKINEKLIRARTSLIESRDKKSKGLWIKLLDFFDNMGEFFTGNVIFNEIDEEDLPPVPVSPGRVEDVMKPSKFNNFKILSPLTGNAIVGVPDWSYDGANGGSFLWDVEFTEPAFGMQHFDLSLDSNFSIVGSVNGIVYSEGYYLNTHEGMWKSFNFTGTKVGMTGWLRHGGDASLTLEDVTDEDYNVFLAYSCLKVEGEWDCNEGKWIIFVVETGETYYHGDIEDTPPMEYTENADLDITDLPSILEQFDVSLFEFQPVMHDISIVAPIESFETEVGNVQKIDFYVRNIGNRNLTNLTFEFDIGEQDLADVVAADIPDFIEIDKTVQASVSLLLKERGKWRFPLFVMPKQEEVDTSDNLIYFNITVGEPITEKFPTDPLNTDWNRMIDYTIKEPYSETSYGDSSLVILSGTNKVRTIFGGYYDKPGEEGGSMSINPTMKVRFKALVTEEALFSTPFVSSIHLGGEMLTGDREPVQFYVVLTNQNDGRKYSTPLMESQYKYYYNPKHLIPDFEFCVNYTAETFLVGDTHETIDIIEPEQINICDFSKVLKFRTKRLLKLDGNYVVVSGGFPAKYFEDVNVQYNIEFTDSSDRKYETPVINSEEGFAMFKVDDIFDGRYINYNGGMSFDGKIILIDNPEVRGDAEIRFGSRDESLHFVWNGWNINQSLLTSLLMKDDKIKIYGHAGVFSTFDTRFHSDFVPWTTMMDVSFRYEFPNYYDWEVRQKIEKETPFEFRIKDLNNDEIIYEFDGSCPDNCVTKTLGAMTQIKPGPEFISGHTYEFSFRLVGDNRELFASAKPVKVFYLDGLQFIANNPLIRTRFMFLENHPSRFSIRGSSSENYLPDIQMDYIPKNLFLNRSSKKIELLNTDERAIKISDLQGIDKYNTYLDYEPQIDKPKPVFDEVTLKIIPINKKTERSDKQFNCKIGRYDLVCYRGSSGYNLNYVDEINGIVYQINLYEGSRIFLKKYRDNPQIYDAVVYDILSEIDRNPIQSFEIPYYVENTFKNPDAIFRMFQSSIYDSPFEGHTGEIKYYQRSEDEKYLNCEINDDYSEKYGDYPIFSSTVEGSISNYISVDVNLQIVQVSNLNVVAEKVFPIIIRVGKNDNDWLEINEWINSLDLINNEFYKMDIEYVNGDEVILEDSGDYYFYAMPFQYKKDYEKEVVEDNSDYIRKIPELSSTIFGAYDFLNSSHYPCIPTNNLINGRLATPFAHKFYLHASSPTRANVIPQPSVYKNPYVEVVSWRFNRFFGMFSVDPGAGAFDDSESTSLDEFRNNTRGERRKNLVTDRFYAFGVNEFEDVYEYYGLAPTNRDNSFDTELNGVICDSDRITQSNGATLYLLCKWSNINDLKIYELSITEFFEDKSGQDLHNLPDDVLNDFKDNYAEVVLRKYLEWYPPTDILNTTFFSYY
jgi:hypothetical protein